MEAGKHTVRELFQQDVRYVIPTFQRPYVWNQDQQWEPLWDDVRNLAERYAEALMEVDNNRVVAERDAEIFIDAYNKNPEGVRKVLVRIIGDENEIETDNGNEKFSFITQLEESFNQPGQSNIGSEVEDTYLPPSDIPDPARRREKTEIEIIQDIINEPEKERRFKKIPSRVWETKNYKARIFLREQYNGHCQICDTTFQKRNEDPYFEGLYIVSRTKRRWIDRPGNVLCLCANCCAKFLHGPISSDNIIEQARNCGPHHEQGNSKPQINLILCGEEVDITYSARHLIDFQEMIKQSTE